MPQDLAKQAEANNLSYIRVRGYTTQLFYKRHLHSSEMELSIDQAKSYMEFIRDNFEGLCERMNLGRAKGSLKWKEVKSFEAPNEIEYILVLE